MVLTHLGKLPKVGAVAMLVKANPQVISLNDDNVYMSDDVMDFWRPIYRSEALVDGHFSATIYQDFFKELWDRYRATTGHAINDFKAFAFHLPFTKMGLKGLREILPEATEDQQAALLAEFEASRVYNRRVGNLYTGSLYLSLISLLANGSVQAGDRIGLFSYGSGAEGEFYSATVEAGFKHGLQTDFNTLFANRTQVSVPEYEEIFADKAPTDGQNVMFDLTNDPNRFVLAGIQDEKHVYKVNI